MPTNLNLPTPPSCGERKKKKKKRIAPFRAAIESGALELPDEEDDGVFGRSCKLYWGCTNEDVMPWKEKVAEWDKRGVEVVVVLSEPGKSGGGRFCLFP